jgi:hypothetical protein
MNAAKTVNEMLPVGNIQGNLPEVQNERQARELAKIKNPEVRAQVCRNDKIEPLRFACRRPF